MLSFAHGDISYVNNQALQSLLRKIGRKEDELSILHSDPELRTRERLVIGYDEDVRNCQLTHDLLGLFARLLDPPTTSASLAKEIGLEGQKREEEKCFKLLQDEGLLINPDDGKRNVSFKQQTFQLLLSGLKKGIQPEDFSNALREAGKQCGLEFGDSLTQDWGGSERMQKDDYRGIQADIQEWCKFDSAVGFGRFKLGVSDKSYVVKGRSLQNCNIIVQNNFLVPEKTETATVAKQNPEIGTHEFCHFMEGYILGVFQKLFGDRYSVKHLSKSDERPCIFKVSSDQTEDDDDTTTTASREILR